MTMDRLDAKILSIFLAWIIILVSTLMPIKVSGYMARKGKKGEDILAVISCFGGGIFFGTYLMHMTPEVRLLLEDSLLHPNGIDYPLPELFIGIGFFIVLLLEKFVITVNRKSVERGEKKKQTETLGTSVSQVQLTGMTNGGYDKSTDNVKTVDSTITANGVNGHANGHLEIMENGHGHHGHGHSHLGVGDIEEEVVDHGARTIILILGLSLHCIFEGMSAGLQTTTTGVWNLFFAIIAHEFIIAFSVGMQLTRAYAVKGVIVGGLAYSVMTPVGMAIGTIILETQDGTNDQIDMVNGILQGIAAGTFIYVTFLEILCEQLSHDTSMGRIAALSLGFIVMALLSLIPEEGDAVGDTNLTLVQSIASSMEGHFVVPS